MKKVITSLSAIVALSAFAVVEKPTIVPRWSGAAIAEWTMDYGAALKQAKAEGKWSLMLYTGSWWCPWCQPLEAKVFDTDAWKDYAAEKGYYEIEMDYPRRNGTEYWCWLWDEDYLAKNSLTAAKATAALKDRYAVQDKYALPDAQKQVCTNGTTKVTYKRIGYPTILVLRPDGTVAGRFSPDVREYTDNDGNVTNHWSEAEAFASVKEQLEAIVDNADTHVVVSVAEDCVGMGTVTAVDKTVYTGTSIALKATAAKGYYFAGWYDGGAPAETVADYRTANNSYVTVGGEVELCARFVTAAEDCLSFDFSDEFSAFDLDEEVDLALEIDSVSMPSVTISGLPKGLKFDAKTLSLSGCPTVEDIYYITISAKNASGYVYSQVVKCTVGDPEEPEESEFDAFVNFDAFEDLLVGVAVEAEIGRYSADDKEGVTAVSGLPAGLSVKKETEDGDTVYYMIGTPTKAGLFTVTVKSSYLNESGRAVSGSSKANVIVGTTPSVYIAVDYGEGGKSATGTGVYAAGATATIKATAEAGYVFAGWKDEADGTFIDGAGYDCRNPTLKLLVNEETAFSWYATFVAKDDDSSVVVESDDFVEDEVLDFDATVLDGEPFRLVYAVQSASLPTVKVTGLPAGFTYTSGASEQEFEIVYDPSTAAKNPTPGVYPVVITATNLSKVSGSVSFTIKVANWTSDKIVIDDIYPDDIGFTPGEAIDPIDFSGAVGEGVTLSAVTGLPKGLAFNAKANASKGIEANTVTGTPTVPGSYTVMFTAKEGRVTYQATATFVVAPFPTMNVNIVDGDDAAAAEGCKVSGAGGYMSGTKVTLKATAAQGWVFAGWDGPEGTRLSLLNPSLTIVTEDVDVDYDAKFLRICNDWLYVYEYDNGEEGDDSSTLKLTVGLDMGAETNVIAALVDTGSLPTISLSGLPAGLKFDAKTLMLSGKPTKAGVYYTTISAKNAGGYVFTRVLRIMVRNADGTDVEEAEEENTAAVELSDLDYLMTGEAVDIEIEIPEYDSGDDVKAVKSVSVSGLPKGLSSVLSFDELGFATVRVFGIPSAAGRTTVKFAVTYFGNKKANTVHSIVVEDGGSSYLFVTSVDNQKGTVSGEGVYSAGETVKLTAKAAKNCVFAGWWTDALVDEETGEVLAEPFEDLEVDYRTPTVSCPMTIDLAGATITGMFVASADDGDIAIEVIDDTWEIVPSEDSVFEIDVSSVSLPTVTVGGLPKGVSFDKATTRLVYNAADRSKLFPGVYTVTLNAQNVSKKKAETLYLTVYVPIQENEFFTGYGLDQDEGYDAQAGTSSEDALAGLADALTAMNADGLKVTAKNLPAGVKLAKVTEDGESRYVLDGVPTKPGVYTASFTATGTMDGVKVNETGSCFITVEAIPEGLVGTYNGSVYIDDPYDFESESPRTVPVGSLMVTATAAGKVTVKIIRPTGTYSFSVNGWDGIDEMGGATVKMFDTKGRLLSLTVEPTEDNSDYQMTAFFVEDEENGKAFEGRAQRNAFADGDPEALAVAGALKGTYKFVAFSDAETLSGHIYSYQFDPSASTTSTKLTVTVDAKGGVKFAGKYGAKSVSGSTVLAFGTDEECATTMTAELIWKNDAESVGIAMIAFVYDDEADAWSLVEQGDIGAKIEVYKSDCDSCYD